MELNRVTTKSDYAALVEYKSNPSAEDPLYSGQNLRDLADYLGQREGSLNFGQGLRAFAWSYQLTATHPLRAHRFSSLKDFEAGDAYASSDDALGQLVFLTGYPSPDWLNAIGAKYDIDPNYYHQHMSFRQSASTRENFFALPPLPSSSRYFLKLSITTVGYIKPRGRRMTAEELVSTRRECQEMLNRSFREQTFFSALGSPVVRRFYLHNDEYFTIEQEATIYLARKGEKWAVLVWVDAAGEGETPEIPLRNLPAFANSWFDYAPSFQDRTPESGSPAERQEPPAIWQNNVPQALSLLASNYGKTLKPHLAARDPFYVLHELYNFAACAEVQFLNMVAKVLTEQTEKVVLAPPDAPRLSDFQYTIDILGQHRTRLEEMLSSLQSGRGPVAKFKSIFHATQPSPELAREAGDAMDELVDDITFLLEKTKSLLSLCERAVNIEMSNEALLESKRSNEQAQAVTWLTRLGTWVTIVYAPLSYICSVFGMNFAQFGQGRLSLWLWAAVSGPVLVVSLVAVLGSGYRQYRRRGWSLGRADDAGRATVHLSH